MASSHVVFGMSGVLIWAKAIPVLRSAKQLKCCFLRCSSKVAGVLGFLWAIIE